ncbi:hypothetical protein SteCoe_29389 [Stentor coeruleus]|uniref:Uncharacterized protein n=1 Tax=Stentor coeruleus TaxID=5963 RepID=A0A1R2B5Z3_9CILI|nr:hypothetical protein SteCoe_29389 [Stentor coeruleus]
MAKIAYLLCLIVLINAIKQEPVTPADALAFTLGFIQGVETDPSAQSQCATDLSTLVTGTDTLVNDVLAVLEGGQGAIFKLVTDLQNAKTLYEPVFTDCNFSGLEAQIQVLLSPKGYNVLMSNYFKNMQVISTNIPYVEDCTSDYSQCGQSAGIIFKSLVGWSLNSQHETVAYITDPHSYISFLQGLIVGLEANPNESSACASDITLILTNSDTLIADIENALLQKQGAIVKLITDYNNFVSEIPNFSEDCNFASLVAQVQQLLGPNGFNILFQAYMKNNAMVTQDVDTISVCDQDLYACGSALGDLIKIFVQWSI